jgi:hypothetical protein
MTLPPISPERRREVIDALRRGTVPERGLDLLAVGLDHLAPTLDDELETVARGRAGFKAVRGEYGSGKTFTRAGSPSGQGGAGLPPPRSRYPRAKHPCTTWKPYTVASSSVFRRPTRGGGALRSVIDGWFFTLEEEVLAAGEVFGDRRVRAPRRDRRAGRAAP